MILTTDLNKAVLFERNKNMRAIITILFLIPVVTFSKNYTGKDLRDGCFAIITPKEKMNKSTPDELTGSIFWMGYIQGFIDSKTFQQIYYSDNYCKVEGPYCQPQNGIEVEEVAHKVIRYFNRNPEHLSMSSRIILPRILADNYPCK